MSKLAPLISNVKQGYFRHFGLEVFILIFEQELNSILCMFFVVRSFLYFLLLNHN